MKAFRIIFFSSLPLLILLTSYYFYLVYKNNIDVPPASKQEIQQALDKSINWVLKNQNELIKTKNSALWWFLDESAKLTSNSELINLTNKYKFTVLNKKSVWSGYFTKTPPFTYFPGSLGTMKQYQKFLIYGLTCDATLGDEPFIQKQLDINFCNWTPFYSSCSTHQLMGIRLLQTKNCSNQKLYQKLSNELSEIIEKQLTWDPRVGDVYIQRVLMLKESGHTDKIKPVWISRILKEQRSDGGWANFYNMLNLTDTVELGFGYVMPEIRSLPTSSFHTTAQAIYLLSTINSERKFAR